MDFEKSINLESYVKNPPKSFSVLLQQYSAMLGFHHWLSIYLSSVLCYCHRKVRILPIPCATRRLILRVQPSQTAFHYTLLVPLDTMPPNMWSGCSKGLFFLSNAVVENSTPPVRTLFPPSQITGISTVRYVQPRCITIYVCTIPSFLD